MDPNVALKEIMKTVELIQSGQYYYHSEIWSLTENLDNLNDWLSKGGFLPEEWAR